jgi:hypothetical protein
VNKGFASAYMARAPSTGKLSRVAVSIRMG